MGQPIINYETLQSLSWEGIPAEYRGTCWRILLKYMPTNSETREASLRLKREEYQEIVRNYVEGPADLQKQEVLKQIRCDILRTLPDAPLFRQKVIQELLIRVLYAWSIRHPACSYVQGINDIVTPFLIVFLNEHLEMDLNSLEVPPGLAALQEHQLQAVEADCYWCLTKTLGYILDNYTAKWPGIQKNYELLMRLIRRVDGQLLLHFEELDINLYHTFLQCVNCMLLRQFNHRVGLRLYDTYMADTANHSRLSIYLFAVIFLKYSKKLKRMGMEEAYLFIQNMPTKSWNEVDLSMAIAEAFVYMSHFHV